MAFWRPGTQPLPDTLAVNVGQLMNALDKFEDYGYQKRVDVGYPSGSRAFHPRKPPGVHKTMRSGEEIPYL